MHLMEQVVEESVLPYTLWGHSMRYHNQDLGACRLGFQKIHDRDSWLRPVTTFRKCI